MSGLVGGRSVCVRRPSLPTPSTSAPRWAALGVAVVVLVGVFSGCNAFIVKGGRLHEMPSSAVDLPFRSAGAYVSDGATLPCGREAEGLIDLADSARALAVVFTDTGEFLMADSVSAIREDAAWVRHGNYRVENGWVDARTYSDGGDSSYRGYVDRYTITPTGPDSFIMDRVLDKPPQWVRYNTYSERERVCIRQAFTFEPLPSSAHLGTEAEGVGANRGRRDG